MIRSFKDIEEFKAVTGFKEGDFIRMRGVDVGYTKEIVGQFTGYEHISFNRNKNEEWSVYIGNKSFELWELFTFYEYYTAEGWLNFCIDEEQQKKLKEEKEKNFQKIKERFKDFFLSDKELAEMHADRKKDNHDDDLFKFFLNKMK